MTLGERLRLARIRRNWSLRDLAAAAGMTHTPLYNIETGKSEPSAETIRRLCAALSVSADWLLGLRDGEAQDELDRLREQVRAWEAWYRDAPREKDEL